MGKKANSILAVPAKLAAIAEFRFRLRRFLSFSEAVSEQLGVPAQQYQLIQVVAAVPCDTAATISYIAERMLLRHNSAVELVDRAERSGLVRRLTDESDHRRSVVDITEEAEAILSQLMSHHLAELQREGPALVCALQNIIGNGAGVKSGRKRKTGER
ncbi:MAG TPA: MarR family transcriptional regulator [Edaphobacter sp.]|jgi:DNA-binding MarR family transcriptional regulator|nr:MarR family transcriptional regulator [Edaphobacter sp.]